MDLELDIYDFDEKFLAHYGTPRHSGRYPFGSGDDPSQRHTTFLAEVARLRKEGLSDNDIARGMGVNSAQFRARNSIAKNELNKERLAEALKLQAKGVSNVAIGQRLGIPESSVRALLKPSRQERVDQLTNTADVLKKQVADKGYLDVGAGTNLYMGVSTTQLNNAVAKLQEGEGYRIHYIKVQQQGTGEFTKLKVLAPPTEDGRNQFKDIVTNPDKVKTIQGYSEDQGRTFRSIQKPVDISSKRLQVRYGEEGGDQRDGVIELRRNVDDISLGNSRYAQVRISVDGTHYLKGMAMYADDLPAGVDLRFNTNKSREDSLKKGPLGALKDQKTDPDNPFGATIRQKTYIDKDGKQKLSALNIVGSVDPEGKKFPGEEGGWSQWSKSLSSQVLSKQSPALAKRQLDEAFKAKQAEYDEIMALTNPTVRKRLLESFADDADSSAVHLKAAALPRQATHVILPINSMKETEIYAPNYRNGEKVALVRYPHGGIFEIPELTVNNKVAEPNRLIKNARDAVGINAKVAARLSGADFDGDTVLVIPNGDGKIKTMAPLAQLKGFDPQKQYKNPEGTKPISAQSKQTKMGDVSNLITDMTIKGAPPAEIARAVRHSMVVIDSEKHNLNWKQSAKDNGIAELKKKYQGASDAGAATLISRSSSKKVILERRDARQGEGGPIDIVTGEKRYVNTGNGYLKPGYTKTYKNGSTKDIPEEYKYRQQNSTKMAEAKNAYSLITGPGTQMEIVYADHANRLKALGNTARKSYLQTPNLILNPSSKKVYSEEVKTLKAKLDIAKMNSPLERQAQIFAGTKLKMKLQENPNLEPAQIKKLRGQSLIDAREQVGAKKQRVEITDNEWKAIQAGAISNNFLREILANTNLDRVKELATPRNFKEVNPSSVALARTRLANGHTLEEVASSLGISTSTLNRALGQEG